MVDYAATFSASLERLSNEGKLSDTFVERFYERFIDSSPVIADKFAKADPEQPKRMLRESFFEMREFSRTHMTNPYLLTLSRIHGPRGYDISTDLYDLWLDALVQTVRELDPEVNDNVELAWRITMAPGLEFMSFYRDK